MGFTAISIRTSTERPEAIDAGTIILGGITRSEMINSIHLAKKLENKSVQLPVEYNIVDCSSRIVKLIQSYTPIVNKVIWNK
jgi:UDP-N-acetylglucosamine 2-epimerase (non-hydrolysing)